MIDDDLSKLLYKGFHGSAEKDHKKGMYFGEILGIKDLIMYYGKTMPVLEKKFKEAVDKYIEKQNNK
jgi:predicted HicB family RNase H-like nuclease